MSGATRRTTHDATTFERYLEGAIDCAEERAWLKVPWFASEHQAAKPILRALIKAARDRKLDVRVIVRPEASNTVTMQSLAGARIPTRTQRYLHEKELLIDDRLISF